MSNESITEWLNTRAIEDSYLYELLAESQIRYGDNLLGISKKIMDKNVKKYIFCILKKL